MRGPGTPLALLLACILLVPPASACGGDPPWDSVILVVVDTLRADHLGLYGYPRPTSPEVDDWGERAVVFGRAFAPSPWTLPSFGSIFTGELPSRHHAGSYSWRDGEKQFWSLSERIPTLAERLVERGRTTGAVMNNPFLHPRFGIARGFETYDHAPGGNRRIRRADAVVDRALAWLDEHSASSFFLTVHVFDPHLDYNAPPPFRGRFTGGSTGAREIDLRATRDALRRGAPLDREFIEGAYDEEIAFVDAQLGRFLAAIRDRRLLERTLVLLTSDHGEELFDHGGFEHGHTVFQELLHVPLLAWGKGVVPRRVESPVSLIDLHPTILEAMGVDVRTGLPGLSLVSTLRADSRPRGRPLIAERTLYGRERRALVDFPWKLVVTPDAARAQLFDLAGDPGERYDLATRHPERVASMRAALAAATAPSSDDVPPHRVELDGETRERLRSLGYLR